MEDRRWEFNVAKVARTGEVVEMTCCTAVSHVKIGYYMRMTGLHISFFGGAERRIVETSNCRPSKGVEKFWVYDLLY
jgi:hypothetical protein